MATHSSSLTWKINRQRSLVGYSPWGRKKLDVTEQLSMHACRKREREDLGSTDEQEAKLSCSSLW